MDRKKIKAEAKLILKENLWKIFIPYLIIELIIFLIYYITKETISNEGVNSLIVTISQILMYPFSIGLLIYIFKIIKNKKYSIQDIFNPYSNFFRIFALFFITGLLITLGTLLLIIPGILIAIRLNFAPYVMADGEKDPIECIKKSYKLIEGYRWDYIKFAFSFIGWFLISIVAFWYSIPYILVCDILYYEELKKVTKNN